MAILQHSQPLCHKRPFGYLGISVDAYMDQARWIAPLLLADIAAGILAGAVFFCVGDDDGSGSWDTFELEGEQAFAQLLGQDFGGAAAPKAATLWQEWYNTDGNEHVKEPPARQGAAFLAHATAVTKTKVDIARAVELGMPQAVADALEQAPHGQDTPGHIELTAAKLGAAAHRIAAVKAVESAGIAFGAPGRALVRQEVHEWLPKVPQEQRVGAQRLSRSGWRRAGERRRRQLGERAGEGPGRPLAGFNAGRADRGRPGVRVDEHGAVPDPGTAPCPLRLRERAQHAAGLQPFGRGPVACAFEQFIAANSALHKALVDGDAATFARRYNGEVEPYRKRLIDAGW